MSKRNRKHDGKIFRKLPKPPPITDPDEITNELLRFVQAYEQSPANPDEQITAWSAEVDRMTELVADEPPESPLRDDVESLRQYLVDIGAYFRAGNPKSLVHGMRRCAMFGYRLAICRCRLRGFEHAAVVGRELIQRPAKSMTPAATEARGVTAAERTAQAERLAKEIIDTEPQLANKAIYTRIARELGLDPDTLRRYLPARRIKEFR